MNQGVILISGLVLGIWVYLVLLHGRYWRERPAKPALEGPNPHIAEVAAKLRRRRDLTVERFNSIPGWSCVPPRGAFYAFPRFSLGDLKDTELVRDLILQYGVVLVHGSGFGQDDFSHVRVVFLPQEEVLEEAYGYIAEYSREKVRSAP